MKLWIPCIAVICAAGCGVGSGSIATSPGVTDEFAPSETSPGIVPPLVYTAQTAIPGFDSEPSTPSFPAAVLLPPEGSVELLGALLDALLVELLAPSGPRLLDSMTYLERLCLEGDDTDTFCRQRFSR